MTVTVNVDSSSKQATIVKIKISKAFYISTQLPIKTFGCAKLVEYQCRHQSRNSPENKIIFHYEKPKQISQTIPSFKSTPL